MTLSLFGRQDDFKSVPETRPTWTEAWRHECECRYLLSLKLEYRRMLLYGNGLDRADPHYLAGIEKVRGAAALARIQKTLTEMVNARAAA